MTVVLNSAVLQDAYFTQRNASAVAETPFFRIATAEWGYGFSEEVDGEDSVSTITTEETGLESVLYECTPTLTSTETEITVRCVLPAGVVEEGETSDVTAINIKDAEGNCLAISAFTPITVTSTRLLQMDITISEDD